MEQGGTVKARGAVIDEDLKSKVRNLADHGLRGEMGVSIRAIGEAREAPVGRLRLVYDEWSNFLGNPQRVDALLGRLRHYCHTVSIDGPSLRQPQG